MQYTKNDGNSGNEKKTKSRQIDSFGRSSVNNLIKIIFLLFFEIHLNYHKLSIFLWSNN